MWLTLCKLFGGFFQTQKQFLWNRKVLIPRILWIVEVWKLWWFKTTIKQASINGYLKKVGLIIAWTPTQHESKKVIKSETFVILSRLPSFFGRHSNLSFCDIKREKKSGRKSSFLRHRNYFKYGQIKCMRLGRFHNDMCEKCDSIKFSCREEIFQIHSFASPNKIVYLLSNDMSRWNAIKFKLARREKNSMKMK